MMQSQKLLGLSIYLPWLQAQMPLDTVSEIRVDPSRCSGLLHQLNPLTFIFEATTERKVCKEKKQALLQAHPKY